MTTLTGRPLPAVGPDGVNPSRARSAVRALYTRPALTAGDLSAPLLALPDGHPGAGSLPGAVPLAEVQRTVARWGDLGIRGVKVFVLGHDRDSAGSAAVSAGNRMVLAVSAIKAAAPDLAVTTEVCGCSWTSGGECVLRTSAGGIDLDATYRLMGDMAVQHAEAGADVVSPTAMLDGSVRAVRAALDDGGLRDVGVNPNLAIHTMLYGPFKELMATDPAAGHRRGLQLEPGRAQRDTVVQARRWIAEGADSLTLQPVMTAVDVLVRLRADQEAPLVAYSTSGEWPALRGMGAEGMAEYIAMLRRAGADHVLTFAAGQVAAYLEQSRG
ncbi:hypothetical protein CIB93_17875 [Streptomyces sp. WZ.A104]|uniref:hypothetical protein n=1 Tax=Streptomyces sp. WZ.A104 TaxID=2023771 RepID=UPI000BBB6D96|nr:hypothetical protein [Streptomyces sp. WZ.A104]PCG84711.1 hypothetical protein CIB93_17875 [Streptomyces sp. WZ.A104]